MSEELERTRKALGEAIACLQRLSTLGGTSSVGNEMAREGLAKVEFLLNSPPEFEEVEECAGWVNIYPPQGKCDSVKYNVTHYYPSQAMADENAASNRIGCQELRVKVKRPVKRPVVREVEVESRITEWDDGTGTSGKAISIRNPVRFPFADNPECHGKTGTLIFRWEE